MLSYESIIKGVNSMLKPIGVPIISEEIRSGFDKPAFFVQFMPIGEDTNNSMSESIVTINIHYFSKEKTRVANLKMLGKLREIFKICIYADDRTLTISDKRYDLENNVLQFKFDIRYTESIIDEFDLEGSYEKMGELIFEGSDI